jgi:hypothetical protein
MAVLRMVEIILSLLVFGGFFALLASFGLLLFGRKSPRADAILPFLVIGGVAALYIGILGSGAVMVWQDCGWGFLPLNMIMLAAISISGAALTYNTSNRQLWSVLCALVTVFCLAAYISAAVDTANACLPALLPAVGA